MSDPLYQQVKKLEEENLELKEINKQLMFSSRSFDFGSSLTICGMTIDEIIRMKGTVEDLERKLKGASMNLSDLKEKLKNVVPIEETHELNQNEFKIMMNSHGPAKILKGTKEVFRNLADKTLYFVGLKEDLANIFDKLETGCGCAKCADEQEQ